MAQRQVIQAPTTGGIDVDAIAREMMTRGLIDPTSDSKKNSWQKMLMQMSMAQKMNPQTMAGFALGKLLRQGFDNWKETYNARGEANALKPPDPNPTTENLAQQYANDRANIDWLNQNPPDNSKPWINRDQLATEAVFGDLPQTYQGLLNRDNLNQYADQFQDVDWANYLAQFFGR